MPHTSGPIDAPDDGRASRWGARLPTAVVWSATIGCALAIGVAAGRNATTLVLPGLVAALVCLIAVVAPHACLHLLAVGLPFSFRFLLPNRSEVQVPSEPLIAALVAALVLDALAARARHNRSDPFPLRAPVTAFVVAALLSMIPAAFSMGAVKGGARSVAYTLVPFVVWSLLRDRAAFLRVVRLSYAAGVIAAIAMIALLSGRLGDLAHTTAYAGSLFTNYAVYGGYLTVFLLPLLSRTLYDSSARLAVPHHALLAVFGMAMLLCLSRGAWVSLLGGMGYLLAQRSRAVRTRKWAIIAVGVAGLVLLLAVPGVYSSIMSRASTVLDVDYASNRTRLLRWGHALMMFAQNPILGGGFGAFAQQYENESFLGENARFQLGAHSEHLQVLAEMGAVGFLSWIWLLTAFFVYGHRLQKRLTDTFWRSAVLGILAYEAAFVVHFVVGNFLAGDRLSVPFWFGIGALPVIERIARQESASEPGS